jgi:microcystin-dependent protein
MAVLEYLGAIKLFAGTFAIKTYAFAQGQTLSIQQNTALFSLLGTVYGGNGVTTFLLPDLRGRLPISYGQGPGTSNYTIGEIGGTESVTLLNANVPAHNHVFNAAATVNGTSVSTAGPTVMLGPVDAGNQGTFYAPAGTSGLTPSALNPSAINGQGGNLPHNNIQPSMGINYIIALQGVFPSRN